MKISAIGSQPSIHFMGENKKANKLRNTAGAAAIVLATAMPMEKADAQIYYPPVYPVYPVEIYTQPRTSIPLCFAQGDTRNDEGKSYREIFDEIDNNGNQNGVISANEVVRTERRNWNRDRLSPFSSNQMRQTEKQFKDLSRLYNEDDSDPNTMNFREYHAVMKDYVDGGAAERARNILNILANPYLYAPVVPPPPRHHHHPHHRHDSHRYDSYDRHTPPPKHRH